MNLLITAEFETAFEHIIGIEGGYSEHPADKGGKTCYGITEAVARENGYTGVMKDLSLEKAKQIYKSQYWNKMRLDEVVKTSELIAIELFETGINMGCSTAVKFLQRALNCFLKDKLLMDGVIGEKTINAINCIPESVLLKMLNAQQCISYMEIVENKSKQAVFLMGWLIKRVTI